MKQDTPSVTIIDSRPSWKFLDLQELKRYRDLFYFLVWRDIKVMYAQTILGFAWSLINPAVQIATFTIIFGKLAQLPTEGVPYALFSSVALIPWTYMSAAIGASSQSLVSGRSMLGKIYFPRLMFPIVPVLTKFVDFGISTILLIFIFVYYGVTPTRNIFLFPVFIVMMVCIPIAFGLWLSSLAIRFRDVSYVMGFFTRMLMYSAPIVYSASKIPEKYRIIYSLNPIVGVIEGLRSTLLGTPFYWQYIIPGAVTLTVLLFSGAFYFKYMERVIVDVI